MISPIEQCKCSHSKLNDKGNNKKVDATIYKITFYISISSRFKAYLYRKKGAAHMVQHLFYLVMVGLSTEVVE